MTSASTEFDGYLKSAARASSLVKLVEVSFAALEARLMPLPSEETEKLSWNVRRCEGRWFREDAELRVLMPYIVDVATKTAKSGRSVPVARIAVTMRVTYSLKDPAVDDETLHGYATITPLMHTWPYLRAEVQALTTKLDLPPLLIPVIVSGNAQDRVHMARVAPDGPAAQAATADPHRPKRIAKPRRS